MSWEKNFKNYYDKKIGEIPLPANTITAGRAEEKQREKENSQWRFKLINSVSFAAVIILILTAFACQPKETKMAQDINRWYFEKGGKEIIEETMVDLEKIFLEPPESSGSPEEAKGIIALKQGKNNFITFVLTNKQTVS